MSRRAQARVGRGGAQRDLKDLCRRPGGNRLRGASMLEAFPLCLASPCPPAGLKEVYKGKI